MDRNDPIQLNLLYVQVRPTLITALLFSLALPVKCVSAGGQSFIIATSHGKHGTREQSFSTCHVCFNTVSDNLSMRAKDSAL